MTDIDDLVYRDYHDRGLKSAGLRSAETKRHVWGPDEHHRAGKQSVWTKQNRDKAPDLNPWTRENYYSAPPVPATPVPDDPLATLEALHGHEDPQLPDDFSAFEGQVCLVHRMTRTRVRLLTELKKREVQARTGALLCEACGFNFAMRYGPRGRDYCEVHHEVSISERVNAALTHLDELRVLCANCHRMIHRKKPWLTFDQLRASIVGAG